MQRFYSGTQEDHGVGSARRTGSLACPGHGPDRQGCLSYETHTVAQVGCNR
jgi:hypothetical protein